MVETCFIDEEKSTRLKKIERTEETPLTDLITDRFGETFSMRRRQTKDSIVRLSSRRQNLVSCPIVSISDDKSDVAPDPPAVTVEVEPPVTVTVDGDGEGQDDPDTSCSIKEEEGEPAETNVRVKRQLLVRQDKLDRDLPPATERRHSLTSSGNRLTSAITRKKDDNQQTDTGTL